jgi:hypothetical protein
MTDHFYAVRRLEGTSAVLIDSDDHAVTVPRSRLPYALAEGDVLRVPVTDDTPDWGRAVVDSDETRRRQDESRR